VDTNFVTDLLAKRANINETQRGYMEGIHKEGRLPSAEETVVIERMDAEYDELTEHINGWIARADREKELETARAAIEALVRPGSDEALRQSQRESEIERWFRGAADGVGPKSFEIDLRPTVNMFQAIRAGADETELRALYTDGGASGGSLVVPVGFYNQVYQYVEEKSAIRRVAQIFTSNTGGAWTFPKTTTNAVGTQVIAQGTAIGGTDPVLGTIRLDAYRFGDLVKVSNTMIRDTGFDLLGYIAKQVGYAVGRVVDTQYVSGGGSAGPNGIITAASVGATTGGSLIALGGGAATAFTQSIDPLITLQHSIAEDYADNGAFVMNRLTGGTLRKLRDGGAGTVGSYVWTPTTTFDGIRTLGVAGELLGSPVHYDYNFGTNGSAVKPVAFGDWSTYYIRDVGTFRFERSDERYFDTDEVGFRGLMETDADLVDTGAIKVLQQAV
jgi:HK97 family phage major capsid protein